MKMLVPLKFGLVGGTWFTEVTSVVAAAAALATFVLPLSCPPSLT
jgi:hypothetical protein